MKIITGILILFLLLLLGVGCKKNNVGGNASILIHTAHHDRNVKDATVYVKFDAQEMPADIVSNYDLKVSAEQGADNIHITDLRYGNYYLYAVGNDSATSQKVYGGVPVTIAWKERKNEIEIHIPLTE